VLKAFSPEYQENPSYTYRADFVARLRRDLAFGLGMENPDFPGMTFYETGANGQWVNLAEQQGMGLELRDDFGVLIDYTLAGMQRLLNSRRDVGDEVYKYVSDMLGIDIFIVRGTNQDIYPHITTRDPNNPRNAVVIVGNGYHYETIAVDHGPEVGFQTMFMVGDPFIEKLESLVGKLPGNQPGYDQTINYSTTENVEDPNTNGTIVGRELGLNPERDQVYVAAQELNQNRASPMFAGSPQGSQGTE